MKSFMYICYTFIIIALFVGCQDDRNYRLKEKLIGEANYCNTDSNITVKIRLINNSQSDLVFLLSSWLYDGQISNNSSSFATAGSDINLNSIHYMPVDCSLPKSSFFCNSGMDRSLSKIKYLQKESFINFTLELPKYRYYAKDKLLFERFVKDSIYVFEIKLPYIRKEIYEDIVSVSLDTLFLRSNILRIKQYDVFPSVSNIFNSGIVMNSDTKRAIDDNVKTISVFFEYKATY